MRTYRQIAIFLAVLIACPTLAWTQAISFDRLRDWEFRFYVCKHVILNGTVIIQVMAQRGVTGELDYDEMEVAFGPAIVKSVTELDGAYELTDGEASFVSDLTLAILHGMIVEGGVPSEFRMIEQGSDLCIRAIDSFLQ